MSKTKIYGYKFAVVVKKSEYGFSASCPGIGGIYVESDTEKEAVENALLSAQSILQSRENLRVEIEEDNEYLEVVKEPIILTSSIAKPTRRVRNHHLDYIAFCPAI